MLMCSFVLKNHLQEVEQLRQEKLQIDQELRSYHGPTSVSSMHFPSRRTDRPYGDMDGMGGGRGRGSRGGSRPPRGAGGRGVGRGFGEYKFMSCLIINYFSLI